eukprot:403339820
MSKQLKINSQLTSRQQILNSSHQQDNQIRQANHSQLNQLAISRINSVHENHVKLVKYSQVSNSENQALQRTANNILLPKDSIQEYMKQAQDFDSNYGGLNILHGTHIQPASMWGSGKNDQSNFQKYYKPQQSFSLKEFNEANMTDYQNPYNSVFHQHDSKIIRNSYLMEPQSPQSTTQDTAQSMAGSWSPQLLPDQMMQQTFNNQECSLSHNNYFHEDIQNEFSQQFMNLDIEENSFDSFMNNNMITIDQDPDFKKSATNRPSYFSDQRALITVPQAQDVMGYQRLTTVEYPWSQYQQFNGFYGSDLEASSQLYRDDVSQKLPQYLNRDCVSQTLSTDEDTSVNMQWDQRRETVEARDTSTTSSQSTQLVEASNQKVSKSNFVSTSDHSSSVDVPPSNEPQDRRHIEPQLKEVKTKKDYGYKFMLRNFRQSFAEDFLKHLIQVYEEFYHSESISAEEHMEKVQKKFYKEPIQDIIEYVASFLKVFHFIEEPSDYQLFQAVVFILPTRYGCQVPKKTDSSKVKDSKKPKKLRTIEELALDQIKFEKKQKKLRGNLTELFDMLPEAWLPSQNFSGNDYFDKATKDLRNRFFKLDFVGLVWNRTMANATEKIIKFRGNTHAQHEQTFRKITTEFLTKRSEFLLPLWWLNLYRPANE